MNVNQFAVYQVKDGAAFREYRFCLYDRLKEKHLKVDIANYEQVYISPMLPKDTAVSINERFKRQMPRNFKGHSISVSDVYVLNQDGIVSAYYVDRDKLIVLPGFLHLDSSGTVITVDTTGYQIEGKSGTWAACDAMVVDGYEFYLMQNEHYGDNAAYIILSGDGKIAADSVKKFDENAVGQIRNFLHPEKSEKPTSGNSLMENQQDGIGENGDLNNAVSETEQTQDSIEEQISHLPKPRVIGKRTSALDRLHIKQAEIAIRSGKPIPKNFERMNEELNRK